MDKRYAFEEVTFVHFLEFFSGFAARERMREAKPVKLKKVAFSHFFDTLKGAANAAPFMLSFVI